jgi:predicted Rossmann fold flavoprotein
VDATFLIIGAGPAGLFAAWTASRQPGARVLVLDRLAVPGTKLAATGGGRGNLSHLSTEEEFAAAFGPFGRFTLPAFRALPPHALCERLASIGEPASADSAGRIYPRSQSAARVRDALVRICRRQGVRFLMNHTVREIRPPETTDAPWRIDDLTAGSVLLAAGGASAPRLGSDGSGFSLAAALGYRLLPPVPALTPLRTTEIWPAAHSGVSLPHVTVSISGIRGPAGSAQGELLFTHHGLSGPAILNLSGRIARLRHDGRDVQIRIRFLDAPLDVIRLRQTAGTRTVLAELATRLPRALSATFLELSGIPQDLTFSRLSGAQQKALERHLLACPFGIRGTGGFHESMVTAGGISLKQVHPDTLEGRLTPRLHVAGELLDLDAPTGGWNLHWAFCSGHLAALHAAPSA